MAAARWPFFYSTPTFFWFKQFKSIQMKSNFLQNTLFAPWNLMRVLRMTLGGFIIYEGYKSNEALFMFAGGMFVFMALLNVGCFGSQGCQTSVPVTKQNLGDLDEIVVEYEEVK